MIDLATIYTCYDLILLGKQRPKVAEVDRGRAGPDPSLKPALPHALGCSAAAHKMNFWWHSVEHFET